MSRQDFCSAGPDHDSDLFFIEKMCEFVGLYLHTSDRSLMLCVDTKRQIQALERTQPMLPMGIGDVKVATHD